MSSQPQIYPTVAYVFDPNAHQIDAGMDPVPAGVYDVIISKVILRANKEAHTGWHCALTFKIVNGEFTNREVINNYNLGHATNAMAMDIAHKQFNSVLHVIGHLQQINFGVSGGREIEGKALKITVANDGKYNEVKGVMDVNGNRPGKTGSGVHGGTPVATATPANAGQWGNQPAAAPVAVAQPTFTQPVQPAYAAPVAPAAAQPAAPAQPAYAPPAQPAAAPQPSWNAQPAAPAAAPQAGSPTPPWAGGQPTAA